MSHVRRLLPTAILVLFAAAALLPQAPAESQDADLTGTPQADCGPGSDPEGEIQGRVPLADHESGRVDRAYTCNTELVGHQGATGGFKVHRHVDAQGQECAYYDSTLLAPTDLITQVSTGGAGVIVLDMADPANPRVTATLTTPAMLTPHESLALNQRRGLLVAATGTAATEPGIVDVYDVAQDCTQPVLQASAPVGFLGHESGFAPDGMTYYVSSTAGDSIIAVDLTDPTAPTPVAFLPLNSHGMTVSEDGTRLYTTPLDVSEQLIPGIPTLGNLEGGIAILDVTAVQDREPMAQAEVISTLTWPEASIAQTAIPVTIDGSPHLIEIDEFVNFRDTQDPQAATPGVARIIDISDEANPFVVSNIRLDVHDPAIRNSDVGLEADPGNDMGSGSFAQGYAGHYCAVPRREEPGIVACSMIASGLRVFDIRDPQNPVEIAYFNQVTPEGNPISSGGAWAMSAPAFVPERSEIWYSDANSGFWAVRLTNGVWPFTQEGATSVSRLAGPTRIETAVAASADTFPGQGASAAVLARADDFPDALAGGPLAVAVDGPLLLSHRSSLPDATADELQRALAPGATVHVLGGTRALSADVAQQVRDLGFTVVRYDGANRFDTAALIAEEGVGDPGTYVIADGGSFMDAVVAAPAAGAGGAALLLSDGDVLPEETRGVLDAHPNADLTAIGASATGAAGDRADLSVAAGPGGDLSVAVAELLLPDARSAGIARDDVFADALTAGALLGRDGGGPVLLVGSDRLPDAVAGHLSRTAGSLREVRIFGGSQAISPVVEDAVRRALAG